MLSRSTTIRVLKHRRAGRSNRRIASIHEVLEHALERLRSPATRRSSISATFVGLRPGARPRRSATLRGCVARDVKPSLSASSVSLPSVGQRESRREVGDDHALDTCDRYRPARHSHHVRRARPLAVQLACQRAAGQRSYTVVTSSRSRTRQRQIPRVAHAVSCDANACLPAAKHRRERRFAS